MLLSAAVALVVSAAAAEVAAGAAYEVFDVFPDEGTTLPANARLLVAGAGGVLITHDDGRTENLEVQEPFVTLLEGDYGVVVPTLTAGETITLEPVCFSCGTPAPMSFVVGPADSEPPTFAPGALEVVEVRSGYDGPGPFAPRTGFYVMLSMPVVLPDGEPVLVHVDVDGEASLVAAHVGGTALGPVAHIEGPDARDVCIDVSASDVAGNVSAPLSVCTPLQGDGAFGCSQGSAASTAVFSAAALVLRRRRRVQEA